MRSFVSAFPMLVMAMLSVFGLIAVSAGPIVSSIKRTSFANPVPLITEIIFIPTDSPTCDLQDDNYDMCDIYNANECNNLTYSYAPGIIPTWNNSIITLGMNVTDPQNHTQYPANLTLGLCPVADCSSGCVQFGPTKDDPYGWAGCHSMDFTIAGVYVISYDADET